MPRFIDQLGTELVLTHTPKRIISLVPSQTELLYDLGLDKKVVGITKFCVHPDSWFRNKTRVGGTKNIQFDRIAALEPDLIIANKEENVKEQIEVLTKNYPVFTSNVDNLDDALQMIRSIGDITNRPAEAERIADGIEAAFAAFHSKKQNLLQQPTALYLIWRDPYMAAGGDTFINDMLQRCCIRNAIADMNRYPELDAAAIRNINPDYLLLSSEPYPFKEKHVEELRALVPGAKILLVDGELFSWYGSRLLQSPSYFEKLFVH